MKPTTVGICGALPMRQALSYHCRTQTQRLREGSQWPRATQLGSSRVAGLCDFRAGFLTLGAIDIWGWVIFLGVGMKGAVLCIVGCLAALVSTH